MKGLEVKKMLEDGNCLFRAVADQVYGDSERYDLPRQMCIDYMVCAFALFPFFPHCLAVQCVHPNSSYFIFGNP